MLLRGSGRPPPEIQLSYGQRRVFSLGLRKRVSAGLPPLYACPPPRADHNFTALMDKLSSTLYRNLFVDGGRSARPYESDSEAASNRIRCGPSQIFCAAAESSQKWIGQVIPEMWFRRAITNAV